MAIDRRRISGWIGLTVGAALVIVGWVAFVLVAARPELRFIVDATPNQTASLTPRTEVLVEELEKQDARVEIATFFERPPTYQNPTRIQLAETELIRNITRLSVDLLRQYNALGGDRVQVTHINPRLDPDRAREWRDRVGPVRGNHVIVVAVFRPGKDGGETVRSKELSVLGELAAIDFGNRMPVPGSDKRPPKLDSFLGEEAISSTVKTLLAGGTPVVYLLEGNGGKLAMRGADPLDYTNLVAALQEEGFKVNSINLGEDEIPKEATVLASLEPRREFSDGEYEKLLAFLRRGGRMFVNLSFQLPTSWNPKLEKLLGPLGLKVGDRMVAQIWNNAPQKKARILEITRMNANHQITEGLFANRRTLVASEARAIERVQPKPEGVSVDTSLLKTVDESWLAQPRGDIDVDLNPPGGGRIDEYGSRSIGAVATIDAGDNEHKGKLVLLSGAMLRNQMIGEGSQRDFGLNCFEWLAERQILMPIRKPQLQVHHVDLGTNEDEVAIRMGRIFWMQVVGTPLLFTILGLFVGWRRRRI